MKTIVLVDDVEVTNYITGAIIRNIDPAHQVQEFTDPVQALSDLDAIQPDIILLDLNMPVLDGWGFLESMREKEMGYKVYILTSSTSMLDRQRSLAFANVSGFLIKPIEEQILQEILQ